jgi:hypothetical protein
VAAPPGVPSPASAFPARESAPPSSGFTTARRASVPHTGEQRRSGEHSTRLVCRAYSAGTHARKEEE